MISEQFAPLFGLNIRTKSRFTGKVEYRTKRDLALNISNAQVTEQKSNDIVMEVGFTKAGMKMPWKSQGRVVTLKNDLTFRFNFTIRNSTTIQRRIEENDQLTDGNTNIQIRPNISYVLNEKLNVQFVLPILYKLALKKYARIFHIAVFLPLNYTNRNVE